VDDGHGVAMELAQLPFQSGTYEDYVNRKALDRIGRKRWERRVHRLAEMFSDALVCETIVLGGGNAKKLRTMPPKALLGANGNAFAGGFRLWEDGPPPPPWP